MVLRHNACIVSQILDYPFVRRTLYTFLSLGKSGQLPESLGIRYDPLAPRAFASPRRHRRHAHFRGRGQGRGESHFRKCDSNSTAGISPMNFHAPRRYSRTPSLPRIVAPTRGEYKGGAPLLARAQPPSPRSSISRPLTPNISVHDVSA